jgi:hypothetical protein
MLLNLAIALILASSSSISSGTSGTIAARCAGGLASSRFGMVHRQAVPIATGRAISSMPGSRVHNAGTFAMASAMFMKDPLIGVGCLLGVLLTPDLDLSENERARNLWYLLWWPYGKLFHHRSRLSHLPVVGTGIRLAYVLWPVWVGWRFWLPPWEILVGLVMADLLHALADVTIHPLMRKVGLHP